LHFEDLEPHRFEDLVRQLAWRWRSWEALDPVGAKGNDRGTDIRGFERAVVEVAAGRATTERREWRFQCKRKESIGPTQMRTVAEELFQGGGQPPYGVVLAAPCDVSRDTLDILREVAAARGAEECVAWTGRVVEDMLMQPTNRDLLFCYFGVPFDPAENAAVDAIIAVRNELEHNIVVMQMWERHAGAAFEATQYQRALGQRTFSTLPLSVRMDVAAAHAAAGTVNEAIGRRLPFPRGAPDARHGYMEDDIRRKIQATWQRTVAAVHAIDSYLTPPALPDAPGAEATKG